MSGEDVENIMRKDYNTYENLEIPTRVLKKFIAHTDEITTMVFNPQGDILTTAGGDRYIKMWNLQKEMETNSLKLNRFPACALAFSQDNELLMVCDTNHVATLFTSRGKFKSQKTFPAHQDIITSTKFVFSTKEVLTASMDGTIKGWSTVTGTKVRSYAAFSKIYDMTLSRTEATIATGHNDSIRLWSNKSF